MTFVFNQYDEKSVKKEDSRDEEENEDDGSMANAEEYDPMEAEDADDDDDDGTTLFLHEYNYCSISHKIIGSVKKNHAPR